MALPASSNPIWSNIISGKKIVQFEFLAVKIFLGTAQMNYKKDPTSLGKLAIELHTLLEKNINLPSVQKDLQKLS